MASFEELQAKFGGLNEGNTLAAYKALIGKPNTVRVNELGIRGLRWAVNSVDEKTGWISVSCYHNGEEIAEKYRLNELTIVRTDKPQSKLIGFKR